MGRTSRNKKPKYKIRNFESGKTKDIFATIYADMIQSQAWKELTNNARVLYIYMKLQYYGQKPINEMEDYFYFNKAMYTKTYKLYTNVGQFYKDRDLLVKNGFIEIVGGSTKTTREKMIYRYSDKWKEF